MTLDLKKKKRWGYTGGMWKPFKKTGSHDVCNMPQNILVYKNKALVRAQRI